MEITKVGCRIIKLLLLNLVARGTIMDVLDIKAIKIC